MKTKITALFLSGLGMLCLSTAFAVVRCVSSVADARVAAAPSANPTAATQAHLSTRYGRLPLRFEANHGQSAAPVKFLARGNGYALFLTPQEAVLRLQDPAPTPANLANPADLANPATGQAAKSAVLRLQLTGANPTPPVQGVEELPGRSNYLLGREQRHWRTNIASFAKVECRAIYPGIDLVWYGNQQQLEHDFIVAPGADPRRIRWVVKGADHLRRAADGALVMSVAGAEVRLLKPIAWQETLHGRREVACEYVIDARQQVSFKLGPYDAAQPLVIDPVLLYSTFLGGSSRETGVAVAVDQARNAYLTGTTFSTEFPGPGPLKQMPPANNTGDIFVAKLNASGTALVYATWLGGDFDDFVTGIAVDKDGQAYLTGYTFSADFPVTVGSLQTTKFNRADAFLAKLNVNGAALVYSTLLGGNNSDQATGIAIDGSGNAYISGVTDSTDLLAVRSATGIQSARSGSPMYKSMNRAGAWAASANGLTPSSVSVVSVNPKTPSVLYAGTLDGIFRSSDGGVTWMWLSNTTAPIGPITALGLDPVTPTTLYAASSNRVYKSADSGQTWQRITILLNSAIVNVLAVDPQMPAIVYAATSQGVAKSTNGGASWVSINNGIGAQVGNAIVPNVSHLVIDPLNSSTLYIVTDYGVYKTTNGGMNWLLINNGLPLPSPPFGTFLVRTLALDPKTPSTLYLGFSTSGIYKTTNGGASWSARNNGLAIPTIPSILALAIDPQTSTTLYAGTLLGGVLKSTDGAETWTVSNTGLRNLQVNALAIDPVNPANLYAGTTSGTDGFAAKLNANGTALSWITYLGGAETDAARAIAVDQSGNAYVAGSSGSPDFFTMTPLPSSNLGADAFIAKINATGNTFVYASRFGGSFADSANALAVTPTGQAVIVGTTNSANFPAVAPLQAAIGSDAVNDAFVTKLNAAGTAFEFSTWLGGTGADAANAVALDGAGNIHVAGVTRSTDFPVREAVQSQLALNTNDAFIAKLNSTGSTLLYSTYLGGQADDQANGIAVDLPGSAYVIGTTASANFPLVNPLQMARQGINDAFVAKLGIEADLALTKIGSRDPVMVNNNFSYALNVTNRGPSPATGVTVTDQLPNGVTFVSATASAGNCTRNGNTVTCQLGNLAVQGSANINLSVTPTAAGAITNTASVTANEADPEAANNQANVQTTVLTLPSIYGRVALANGNPLANVAVALNGTVTAAQQTNNYGVYHFANLQSGGNYTVTPTFGGYSFEPPARSFNGLNADQAADFTATVCAYAIAPANQSFGANGDSGTITVTATARCPWTAVASDSWITFNGAANGSGKGMVNFTVAPATAPRVGRITIAGQAFAIFQGVNACASPKFTAAAYRGSSNASQVEVADFNGDGKLDVVTMSTLQGRNPITISTGNGNGDFAFWVELAGPSLASGLTVADYNGDGRPDIVVTNSGPAFAQMFLNQGNGMFNAVPQISLASNAGSSTPRAVYTAELNRDSRPDLVVLSDQSVNFPYDVMILLNQGNGGFNAPIQLSVNRATVTGVADVNGDGVSDLVANLYSFPNNELRVFLGDGVGSFGAPVTSSLTTNLVSSAFADFNGDGKVDVAASTDGVNSMYGVALLLGDGTGKFTQSVTANGGATSRRVIARDFNSDAKPDVAVAGAGRLAILPGDGSGKLAQIPSVTLDPDSNMPLGISAGHFNGDSLLDLVAADYNGRPVRVYLNRCGAAAGSIIAGSVSDRFVGLPFANVAVKLTGAHTATMQTDSGGNYVFTGLMPGGNYVVTPDRAGVEFTPPSASFTNLTADQAVNFTGLRKVVAVSAASYNNRAIAPDSISAVFGVELTRRNETATTQPLPYTLADAQVAIGPSFGGGIGAPLFFASPSQINLLVPAEVNLGEASLLVYSGTGQGQYISSSPVLIEKVVPGLFAANANGQGVAAAVALRVKADGTQVYEAVTQFNPMTNRFVALPLDVSNAAEQVFLLLFGTGLRNHSGLANVSARVGGAATEVLFAGKQGSLAGLDQVNLLLPRTLAGRGEVDIVLTVDGKAANTVRVGIK